MSKTVKELEREVREILKIELEDIAGENTLLFVAMLYGSDPLETAKIMRFYDEDAPEMRAARICLALHSDAEFRHRAVLLDFFTDSIKAMINIALANHSYGARLIPIFSAFAECAEEHNISDELRDAILKVVEKLRFEMGFAITGISREEIEVVLADDLCEEGCICP